MKDVVLAMRDYLNKIFEIKIQIHPWKEQNQLPFFLLDTYYFFETLILNTPCLLMIAKESAGASPKTVQKHWEIATTKWKAPCIYVQNTISSYDRKRLIMHSIPFAIPNTQIYLPDLGIDLKEHFQQQRSARKSFSPSTQAVLLFALLKGSSNDYISSDLAKKLGYSLMTMSRAFDELEAANVGEMRVKGKERRWFISKNKQSLWEQIKTKLRTPVKTRVWVKGPGPTTLAGISALAEVTMINPPPLPVYAIGLEDWKKTQLHQLPSSEEAEFELEIWHYNPTLFAEQGRVDPFSLYLSLEENGDERIEAALEELMEEIKW